MTKSTGIDGIPAKLLKASAASTGRTLTHIFNRTVVSGTIPSGWKTVRVTPIFKEGNKYDISNYKPISILPVVMKILERAIHNQLYDYLLKFYYKYKNKMLLYYLAQLTFITQVDIHDHSTRANNQLRTNKPHEHARYCIRHQIPKVINSTPMNILTKINTHSLQGFSRYIKHTIIQSYKEICSIQNCYICSQS